MKCRACWSDDTHICGLPVWRAWLAACLLCAPFKCAHCFHVFLVPFWTVRARQARHEAAARAVEPHPWPARTVSAGAPTRTFQSPPRKVA